MPEHCFERGPAGCAAHALSAASAAGEPRPAVARLPRDVDAVNEACVRLDVLALLDACAAHISGLVIDLTRTRSVDSAGLRAVLAIRDRADELAVASCVAAPREHVRRMLELVDVAGRIPVFPSLAAALAAWSAPAADHRGGAAVASTGPDPVLLRGAPPSPCRSRCSREDP